MIVGYEQRYAEKLSSWKYLFQSQIFFLTITTEQLMACHRGPKRQSLHKTASTSAYAYQVYLIIAA
jgi:hypothetical protein